MNKVETFTNLSDLPSSCANAFEIAEAESFFLGFPWFQNLVKHSLSSDQKVRFYVSLPNSNAPDGTILAARYAESGEGPFKMRVLHSLSNFYSSLFGLAGDAAHQIESANVICKALAEEKPQWDKIELKPLDTTSPGYAALRQGLKEAGYVVQTFFCFGNWYLPVRGRSWAEYLDSLPSATKNTLIRKRKKLEKSGRAKIELVTSTENLDQFVADYNKIYLASWKKPEPFPDFMPGLIRMCAERGILRLGLLYVDGEPAASQVWIIHNGHALIYKLAYDERFADLSVGTILTAFLMERALDVDKVKEIDYLTGDDAYKKSWMSDRRERWGILAMNPRSLRGAAAIVRHIGGRLAKQAAQKFRSVLHPTKQKTEAQPVPVSSVLPNHEG